MIKPKLTVQSLQQKHMNSLEYMFLHNRMYALRTDSSCMICLHQDRITTVSIPVTSSAFDDFLSFEMKFDTMLNLFAALCMKTSYVPF